MELARRLFHLSGLVLLLVPYFLGDKAGWVFALLALLLTIFDWWRRHSPLGQRFLRSVAGILMRTYETNAPVATVYYFWGLALSFLLFGNSCGCLALVVLAVADPLAGLGGRLWPTPAFLRKTLSGTLVCFVSTTLIFWLWKITLLKALGGAILTALLENLSPVDDNLVLPLGVGALCHFFF